MAIYLKCNKLTGSVLSKGFEGACDIMETYEQGGNWEKAALVEGVDFGVDVLGVIVVAFGLDVAGITAPAWGTILLGGIAASGFAYYFEKFFTDPILKSLEFK